MLWDTMDYTEDITWAPASVYVKSIFSTRGSLWASAKVLKIFEKSESI